MMQQKNKKRKGFTFTIAALFLAILMISTFSIAAYLEIPINIIEISDPDVGRQIIKSALIGAAVAASKSQSPDDVSREYIDSVMSFFNSTYHFSIDLDQLLQNAAEAGVGRVIPLPNGTSTYGVIIKNHNADLGPNIRCENIPNGSLVIITDGNFKVVTVNEVNASPFLVTLNGSVDGFLMIYSPDTAEWSYHGTIDLTNNFTLLTYGKSIQSNRWSPPTGFKSILVYNVPPLALILLFDENLAMKVAQVKDFASSYASVDVTGIMLPMNGTLIVRSVTAWLPDRISGGDVFVLY